MHATKEFVQKTPTNYTTSIVTTTTTTPTTTDTINCPLQPPIAVCSQYFVETVGAPAPLPTVRYSTSCTYLAGLSGVPSRAMAAAWSQPMSLAPGGDEPYWGGDNAGPQHSSSSTGEQQQQQQPKKGGVDDLKWKIVSTTYLQASRFCHPDNCEMSVNSVRKIEQADITHLLCYVCGVKTSLACDLCGVPICGDHSRPFAYDGDPVQPVSRICFRCDESDEMAFSDDHQEEADADNGGRIDDGANLTGYNEAVPDTGGTQNDGETDADNARRDEQDSMTNSPVQEIGIEGGEEVHQQPRRGRRPAGPRRRSEEASARRARIRDAVRRERGEDVHDHNDDNSSIPDNTIRRRHDVTRRRLEPDWWTTTRLGQERNGDAWSDARDDYDDNGAARSDVHDDNVEARNDEGADDFTVTNEASPTSGGGGPLQSP